MANNETPAARAADVLVAGAGLAGLAAAFGFARAGFDVVMSGASERTGRGRTVALLDPSVAFLNSLGLWTRLRTEAAPLSSLQLIDDTGTLFPPRPVEFHAAEIGLDAFGWNIENDRMAETLADEAGRVPGLERVADGVAAYDFAASPARARLEDGRTISARLVIGADGRDSKARRAAGLEARVHAYGQSALTVFLSHRLPHRGFSTEFHTPGGPFTLVPLPTSAAAPHRSSLVWVMTEKDARRRAALDNRALAGEIERQAQSLLGAMRIEGERGLFPMTRQIVPRIVAGRLALVGDAAHVFPPLGAQGLNLGLRDVQAIIACAVEAREAGRDIGGPENSERLRTLEAVRYRAADRHGRRTEPRLAGRFRFGRLRPRRGSGGPVRDRAAPALGHARGPRSSQHSGARSRRRLDFRRRRPPPNRPR